MALPGLLESRCLYLHVMVCDTEYAWHTLSVASAKFLLPGQCEKPASEEESEMAMTKLTLEAWMHHYIR